MFPELVKKGIALLRNTVSVEGVLERHNGKVSLVENVRANRETATLSKSLAIRRDVPMITRFDDLKFINTNYDELLNIYEFLNLTV